MNTLFKNGFIFQHDLSGFTVTESDLAVTGSTITYIGDHKNCPVGFVPDEIVDASGKLILPGLINSHTHAYMSLLRNAADDLAFDDWLFKNIMPMEDQLTGADAYWGSLLACMEMIRTGTTCFLDMHMFKGQSLRAAQTIGMRAVLSRGLVGDESDLGSGHYSFRIEEALEEMDDAGSDLITFCLAPHAIYTCDIEFLKHVSDLAAKHQLRLHIHLSESKNEVDQCKAKHGLTPVQLLDQIGFFKAPVIAAHCVYLDPADIGLLKKHRVSVVTNPVSNMKLGNGFAPVPELLAAGINVCIGTDGSASNNTLNLFREMSILSLVHKGLRTDACAMNALQTFQLATTNAAKALGMEEQLGSLAVGKKADLTLIGTALPQLSPASHFLSAMIYSMNGSEVESVMINGNFVMKNRQFTHINEEEVYAKVNEIRRRIEHA